MEEPRRSSLDPQALPGSDVQIPRPSPPALRLYLTLLSSLWAISALPIFVHVRWLWSAEAFWVYPKFYDFGCYYDRVKLLHTSEFWTAPGAVWTYPAPDIFVYQFLYLFNRGNGGPHKVFFGFLAYLAFAFLALTVAGTLLAKALHERGISWRFAVPFACISMAFCWPVYFSMQRGNIELFLDACIAIGVWAYIRKRWWLFAVVVGIFGSGKLYPLLLLALLLPLRRWKEFAAGLLAAAGVTIFATHWLGPVPKVPTQNPVGFIDTLHAWVNANSMTYNASNLGLDHSMFAFLKRIDHSHPGHLIYLALGYALAGSAGMLLLFFGRVWKLPRPNQLLLVSVAAVLLPPTSFDYTLTLLIPIWAWIVLLSAVSETHASRRRGVGWTVALLALLFAPETFVAWRGSLFAGQLKMLCLLALIAVAASFPLSEGTYGIDRLKT